MVFWWIYFVFSGHPFEPTCWHSPKGESFFLSFSSFTTCFMFSDFGECCWGCLFVWYRYRCCYFCISFCMFFLYSSLLLEKKSGLCSFQSKGVVGEKYRKYSVKMISLWYTSACGCSCLQSFWRENGLIVWILICISFRNAKCRRFHWQDKTHHVFFYFFFFFKLMVLIVFNYGINWRFCLFLCLFWCRKIKDNEKLKYRCKQFSRSSSLEKEKNKLSQF